MGGLDLQLRAAAFGRAVSIISRVSGRAARGSSGYTIPGLSLSASPASLYGLVTCLEGSPEKGLVEGCSRAGEERPNPEMLSLEWVALKSCLGSFLAGLYTPRISGWSSRDGRSEFLLAAGMGCCDSEGELKLWECSTGVLLIGWPIPGWFPGIGEFLLAVDLSQVATLEAQRDEFSLAAAAGCLFLRRRGRKRLVSLG